MFGCEQIWASNNPMGIQINLGYYALAECILKGTYPSDALLRWCGLWLDAARPRKPYTRREYVAPDKELDKKVLEIYRANPTLRIKDIAKMVGRSNTYVSRHLKMIGVRKRSRWDYYERKTK